MGATRYLITRQGGLEDVIPLITRQGGLEDVIPLITRQGGLEDVIPSIVQQSALEDVIWLKCFKTCRHRHQSEEVGHDIILQQNSAVWPHFEVLKET